MSTRQTLLVWICFILLAASLSPRVQAQFTDVPGLSSVDTLLTGEWAGYIHSSRGFRVRLVVHINATNTGVCNVNYDVPELNWYGQRVSTTSCSLTSLVFNSDAPEISFRGAFNEVAYSIEGSWRMQTIATAVKLYKVRPMIRFQEPTSEAQYIARDMQVANRDAGVILNGQLIVPNELQKWPLVVLLNDRGYQDLNSLNSMTSHKPFLVLADQLAKNGWASLRIEDRPDDKSNLFHSIESQESDVLRAIKMASVDPNIDSTNVILLGHGEGGLTALRIATEYPNVRAVICAGTPAISGDTMYLHRIAAFEDLEETDQKIVNVVLGMAGRWIDVVKTTNDDSVASFAIGEIIDETMRSNSVLMSTYKQSYTLVGRNRVQYIQTVLIPWIRDYLLVNPKPLIENCNKPILCLLAEKDSHVPTTSNLAAWTGFARSNKGIDVHVINNVNHEFQTCIDCTADESARTAETTNVSFLQFLTNWLGTFVN
ncbi:MAG: alpha/beta hydrolase [Ignavibacteria bacterium]|nr:alpha/beta hydrolase [Ignavibacteria bacterium]